MKLSKDLVILDSRLTLISLSFIAKKGDVTISEVNSQIKPLSSILLIHFFIHLSSINENDLFL